TGPITLELGDEPFAILVDHFIGVVHVDDTTSLSLKEAIKGLLNHITFLDQVSILLNIMGLPRPSDTRVCLKAEDQQINNATPFMETVVLGPEYLSFLAMNFGHIIKNIYSVYPAKFGHVCFSCAADWVGLGGGGGGGGGFYNILSL
ncbi:hypothetical protein ACJX0J_033203, partial [Zea mays]